MNNPSISPDDIKQIYMIYNPSILHYLCHIGKITCDQDLENKRHVLNTLCKDPLELNETLSCLNYLHILG